MKRTLLAAVIAIFAFVNLSAQDTPLASPEDVMRRFFISITMFDAEGVKATILPADGAEVLWQGEPPPKEALPEIQKAFQTLKLVPIQVGERIALPNGSVIELKPGAITPDRMTAWVEVGGERMPTPFWIEKKDGDWRVDAGSLIAGRKAAAKAMEEVERSKREVIERLNTDPPKKN